LKVLVLSEKAVRKYIEAHECGEEDQKLFNKAKLKLLRRLRKKTALGCRLVEDAMGDPHPGYAVNLRERWSGTLSSIPSDEAIMGF
jgi:hypothetical protein